MRISYEDMRSVYYCLVNNNNSFYDVSITSALTVNEK